MSSIPVLIAGHSQAKYFDKYLSVSNVFVVSFSGYRIDQMFAEIQPLVINYNFIILHVGANDLSRGSPVDQVLTKYQTLVQSIWSTNPKAQVILSGVLPRAQNNFPHAILRTDWLQDYNKRARELNSILTKIASTHHQLTYIGHSNFVCNGDYGVLQCHLLSTDGLHLSLREHLQW
jgi:lysophospholipase L1-like esterase